MEHRYDISRIFNIPWRRYCFSLARFILQSSLQHWFCHNRPLLHLSNRSHSLLIFFLHIYLCWEVIICETIKTGHNMVFEKKKKKLSVKESMSVIKITHFFNFPKSCFSCGILGLNQIRRECIVHDFHGYKGVLRRSPNCRLIKISTLYLRIYFKDFYRRSSTSPIHSNCWF